MVNVAYSTQFDKAVRKIRDTSQKKRVKVQIIRIVHDPETGKPLRWCRKNTREVNVPKNPDKPYQNPQLSDVIELAGNSGLPSALNHFFNLKPVAKERDPTGPAKLQAQIVIKIDIIEK